MVKDINEMEDYIKKFKKKFSGFRSRAPIYFTFQVTPLKVFVQFEEEIDIKEFTIDYNLPVEDTIHTIREWFRDYKYPKIVHSKRVKIEPDISDINNLMIKENATFEEAFSSLSSKTRKETFIIDKVDISKDRIIVLDDKKETIMYQVDMPVLIFVKNLKTLPENSRWKEFEKHCKKVAREK
jgi:hypothetical protein